MTIDETQREIEDEFALFDDWMGKYEHIIEGAKELDPLANEFKTENNLVRGCQSRVWLHTEITKDKLVFYADSDAIITKGLVAMMVRVLSGHRPEEIANAKLDFITNIGLHEHLSPNRSNGLASMVKQMKAYGLAYTSKQNG